jgi:MFS family permease
MAAADDSRAAVRTGPREWYLVAVIVTALILSAMDRHVLILLVAPIQHDLRLSDTQMGVLQGWAFIGLHALATLTIGWLASRFSRRLLLGAGILFWSAMTAGCGLGTSFHALLASRAGVGIGEAVIIPTGYTLVGDRFPTEQRGKVMGILSAASVMGGGAALIAGGAILAWIGPDPLVFPFLGKLEPWQMTFVLLGLLGIPVALLTLALPRDRVGGRSAAAPLSGQTNLNLRTHLGKSRMIFIGIFGTNLLNGVIGIGITAWTPTVMIRKFGTSTQYAGFLTGTALMIGGIVGSFLITAWSDRWVRVAGPAGRLRYHPRIFAAILVTIATYAFAPNPQSVAVAFGVMMTLVGGIFGTNFTAAQDFTPQLLRPRMIALLQFVGTVGSYAIGPVAIAVVTDHVFRNPQRLADSIFLVGGVLAATAFVLGCALSRSLEAVDKSMDEQRLTLP